MEKFRNKYRTISTRAQWWDYGWNASYFITICTHGRTHFFGEILNHRIKLSPLGNVANFIWTEIPDQFKFAKLGEFIVMPNHVHGILLIDKNNDKLSRLDKPTSTHHTGGITGDNNPMMNENLARILRWYKGRVTFECRKHQKIFKWQSRFHDHIIRNENEYQRISTYIRNNPKNWKEDKFHR